MKFEPLTDKVCGIIIDYASPTCKKVKWPSGIVQLDTAYQSMLLKVPAAGVCSLLFYLAVDLTIDTECGHTAPDVMLILDRFLTLRRRIKK